MRHASQQYIHLKFCCVIIFSAFQVSTSQEVTSSEFCSYALLLTFPPIVIKYTSIAISLGASTPLCYKQLGRGWGTSKHNCLVSYLLCWRRHVSSTVGHLQVTKIYIEENYTEYDHSIGAYSKLSTRSRRRLYCTYWAKSASSK